MQSFDRTFQQGSSDEGAVLSKKADPNVILNLAEQRVQGLLDKFAADKTVCRSPTCLALVPRTRCICPGWDPDCRPPVQQPGRLCSLLACLHAESVAWCAPGQHRHAEVQHVLSHCGCRAWWTLLYRQQAARLSATRSWFPGLMIQA